MVTNHGDGPNRTKQLREIKFGEAQYRTKLKPKIFNHTIFTLFSVNFLYFLFFSGLKSFRLLEAILL
jgi:hypothetical protein